MKIVYIFLTVLMFLDCGLLILLVLLQLPKKEAGAGVAFGAGATDALFGAGSGNVLTKITKYVAATFFILAIGMAVIASNQHSKSDAEKLRDELMKQQAAPIGLPSTPTAAAANNNNVGLISNLPPVQSTAPAAKTAPGGTNK